ncbi:MAG: DcaP family trimeric outer membrane transporter [Halioglobus sp.]
MNNRYSKSLSMAVAAAVFALPAIGATDSERIQMLEEQLVKQKAMMEQQQRMLEEMEAQLQDLKTDTPPTQPSQEQLVTVEQSEEPSIQQPLAPRETDFNIYGHLQLDAIYDFKRVDPDYESTLRPSTIPTQGQPFGDDGTTVFSVRQTALGMRAVVPTPMGDVKTWFEIDLFGTGSDAGDTTFSLRHAWVEVGNLGFGQTNSNFMDISIFPNVVDWWGPSGMVFNRNPQLRYTWSGEKTRTAIALEKPNGSFNTGVFGDLSPEFDSNATAKTSLPDLTAHWRNDADWGHYQVAGVLRKLEFETRNEPGNRPNGDDTGWGVNLTGSINLLERDQLKLGVVYGEGIASFMNDGGVNLAPEDFQAEAVPILGVTAYWDHYWSNQWSSSAGFSMNDADPRNQQSGQEFDEGIYASTNILYTPYPELLIGAEFLYGEHKDVSGEEGDDYRIQFTFKHKFSRDF